MDDARLQSASAHGAELPAGFVPLRLVLLPSGGSFDLHQPAAVLGRHSQADLRLALPDISRRHCRFVFMDGHWQVYDLHSLNGVFVNGVRVEEATLFPDDLLRIGGLTFKIQFDAPQTADPEPRILPGPTPSSEQRKAS